MLIVPLITNLLLLLVVVVVVVVVVHGPMGLKQQYVSLKKHTILKNKNIFTLSQPYQFYFAG